MKKTINVLSVISVIFSAVSVLLALSGLTFLWKPMNILMENPELVVASDPIIPIGSMVSIFGCLIVAVILIATAKTKRFVFVEILAIIFLIGFLPILTEYLTAVQTIWIGQSEGAEASSMLYFTGNVLVLPIRFKNISSILCLMICGMRIVNKIGFVKKGISILSISSVIAAVTSVLVSVVSLSFFWENIWNIYTDEPVKDGPIIPLYCILTIFVWLVLSIILLCTSRTNKNIAIGIITPIVAVVLPIISWFLMVNQQSYVNFLGINECVRYAITCKTFWCPIHITEIASYLCLVICGMRIAGKYKSKKQNENLTENFQKTIDK